MSESEYTFSTNQGFNTNDNLNLLNNNIALQITDNTRLNTNSIGDTVTLTFSSPLSENSIVILSNIFADLDKPVNRGEKVININPMIHIKTPIYQIIGRIPYHNFKITNIEVNGYMDAGLNYYIVQIYDPTNDLVIAEKSLSNTNYEINDLGTINNLPEGHSILEINVKISPAQNKSAYIEDIVVYYD
jgi:hypothetical protein